MRLTPELQEKLREASEKFPYPIAVKCKKISDLQEAESKAWLETLAVDLLHPVLQYLSHLLLSDLVASGESHDELYYYVQNILSRPTEGQYVGFLREASRYYREREIHTALPALLEFLQESEVDTNLLPDGKAILARYTGIRNIVAHGGLGNEEQSTALLDELQDLASLLLSRLDLLTEYKLESEDGNALMGAQPADKKTEALALKVVCPDEVSLRPLVIKLKGNDLMLLEDLDISGEKVLFSGHDGHFTADKKLISKGGLESQIFNDLKALLKKVRSEHIVLPEADWESFKERSEMVSQGNIAAHKERGTYSEESYIVREEWEKGGIFDLFLASDKSLLTVTGDQGLGKSALAARLAIQSRTEGNPTLFINGQRLSYFEVTWTGSQYPLYFSSLLNYTREFNKDAFKKLIKQGKKLDPGKQIVVIIDAIDEVDGVTNKWNRFRAMQKLLDWIASVAQPGLKFVVLFDAAIYKILDYLEKDDVPVTIHDISFIQEAYLSEELHWAIRLNEFSEEQAKRLFSFYKELPDSDAAPAFDWEQFRASYGDDFYTLYENPLLFKRILHAMHGKNTCSAEPVDEIILKSVDEVTGADKVNKMGPVRKFFGFLRNSNITPAEGLLADLFELATKNGSPAVIVDQLNPKNKKEKKLKSQVEDPSPSSPYNLLRENGVLEEETVDMNVDGKEVFSRRIIFSERVNAAPLNSIYFKRFTAEKHKGFMILLTLLIFVIPVLLFIMFHSFLSSFYGQLSLADSIGIQWNTFGIMILLLALMMPAFLGNGLITDKYSQIKKGDLLLGSLRKSTGQKSMQFLYKVVMFGILIAALIYLVLGKEEYLLVFLIFFATVLLVFIPNMGFLVMYMNGEINARLMRKSSESSIEHYRSLNYIRSVKAKTRISAIFSMVAIVAGYFLILKHNAPLVNELAYSKDDFTWAMVPLGIGRMLYLEKTLYYIILILFSLLLFSIAAARLNARFNIRSDKLILKEFKRKRHTLKPYFIRIAGYGSITVTAIIIAILDPFKNHIVDSYNMSYLEILDSLARKEELNDQDIKLIYTIGSEYDMMDLTPFENKASFDLDQFKNYNLYLIANPALIQSSKKTKLTSLEMTDPGNIFLEQKFEVITMLNLKGQVDTIPLINLTFPLLFALNMEDEDVARQVAPTFSDPNPNMRIYIEPESGKLFKDKKDLMSISEYDSLLATKYFKMDWFSGDITKCIVDLDCMNEYSENLELIERLWINPSENPGKVLRQMDNLKWLDISYNFAGLVNPSYWTSIRDCLNGGLPALAQLDFTNQYYKNDTIHATLSDLDVDSLSASSREEIIAVLDMLVLKGTEDMKKIDLDLKLIDRTSAVREEYDLKLVYAYEVEHFADERFYPLDSLAKPLTPGDIILSRQSSANDLIFDFFNRYYLQDADSIEIVRVDPGENVFGSWFTFKDAL